MTSDILQWLKSIGLESYAPLFREHAIEMDILAEISDQDLREIGVPLGHRKRILKALREQLEEAHPAVREGPDAVVANSARGQAERRHLSVMFCDLVGSTALSERIDVEDYRDLLAGYQACVAGVVARYEGYIARYMGDGLLVYFGFPIAHEDDAERAVLAALDIVTEVRALPTAGAEPLEVRIGIASGQVVVGDIVGEGASEEHAVLGETPNIAARLQAVAEPGTVAIGESTYRLIAGRFEFEALGERTLKGISRPIAVFRPLRARDTSRFDAATTAGLSELVGRRTELDLVLDRWARSARGEGQVVMLSGEAGVGKSRMLKAFHDRLAAEPHHAVRYQCLPYGSGIAFSPVIEQLHYASGISREDDVRARREKLERLAESTGEDAAAVAMLASLLSITDAGFEPPEMTPQRLKLETISLLVRQLEYLSGEKPLAVVVEDLHWVDPSTREFLEVLIGRIESLPVLLVITHRPGCSDDWDRFGHLSRHSLNRLGRVDGIALCRQVAAPRSLPDALVERILERSDGIPLFIEEVTKTIIENAALHGSGIDDAGFQTGDASVIPVSVRDSLTARLDNLGDARNLAQAAACIGREFSRTLLCAAIGRHDVDAGLDRLVRSGLVYRRAGVDGELFLFKHALIQDSAYESLLGAERRAIHGRIAGHLSEQPDAVPGVLARHFAAAGEPLRAAEQYLGAGGRALSVYALAEAMRELELALSQLESVPAGEARGSLELSVRTALGAARIAARGWSHGSVAEAFAPAYPLARDTGNPAALGPVLWGLCVHYWTRAEFDATHGWLDTLRRHAAGTDDTELAVVHDMSAGCQLFWEADYLGARRHTANLRGIYDAGRHARITAYTNHDPLTFSLHWAGSLAEWISGFPDRAREMMLEAQRVAAAVGHPFNSVFALTAGAECLLMRGDFDEAIRCAERAGEIVSREALGDFAQKVLVDNWRGRALVGKGEFEQGLRLTRGATERWRQAEGRICSAMFWLGEVMALRGMGDAEGAIERVEECIRHCRDTGDVYMLPEVLRVKAELLVATGRELPPGVVGNSETFADAMDLARRQGARSFQLRIANSLAAHHLAGGRVDAAKKVLAPVLETFTEGFDTADLRRGLAMLSTIAGSA